MRTLDDVLKDWEEGESTPSLMIEVTEKCNFKCGHCLRGPANKAVFSQETLVKFLDVSKVKYLSEITFTGGEPLLHHDVITETLKTLWRYDVELGNFYIATNGSAFNKESLLAIAELHNACTDNEISCIEISNSKWHQEERRRLGLNNYIPDDFDVFYDFYFDEINDICENHYPSFNEIVIVKDRRQYKSMVKEGKYKGEGVKPSPDNDGLIYLNARGKMIINSCDLSFKSQAKVGIDL
jgi:organic radical activating enzyme